MPIKFSTEYDQRTLTAMAKALRKTIRKKNSNRTRIFSLALAAVSVAMTLQHLDNLSLDNWGVFLNWLVAAALVISVVFEDAINGYLAQRRRLAGNERAVAVFEEEHYSTQTPKSTTKWNYNRIQSLVELPEFFVFILNEHNAQVFDKKRISGASADEFRNFITNRTGKEMIILK